MVLHINELRDDILDDHLVMVLHINELRDDILDDHLVIFHVGVRFPNCCTIALFLFGMSLVKIRISTFYYALSGSKMRSFATRVLIIELRCYIFPGHHIIFPLEVLAPKSFFF
jgi:hypothetical protein